VFAAGVIVQASITSLNLWQSTLHNSSATVLFHNAGTVKVCLHFVCFTMMEQLRCVYTLLLRFTMMEHFKVCLHFVPVLMCCFLSVLIIHQCIHLLNTFHIKQH